MCGIAGVFQESGAGVAGAAERMGRLMTHRGPDNFTFLAYDERIGLAHNRLSLLDLSAAANQPYRNGDYALVYNGEIYNFAALRERLVREHGVRFETTSDTEVLFYSLIHDGVEKCLREIRGMFAFAFYDRARGELVLARDRLGIKPLYYCRRGGAFYWSSEIKALAATLDLKPDPLKTLFAINGIAERSNEYTLYRDVLPVRPGSYLTVKSGGAEPEEHFYYRLLDDLDQARYRELAGKSPAAIADEFHALLEKSIEGMLVSDAPLGAFVSGGLDSSLISAIAGRRNPDLKLFTANVLGKFSEFEDAKTLAAHLRTELIDYPFEPRQMLADWADVTYHYECPIIVHTNAIPFANIARLTRDSGVKAVLTGEGADELFIGYPRLLTERYKWLAALPVHGVKSLYKIIPALDEYLFPNQKQTSVEFANQVIQGFEGPRREGEIMDKLGFLDETNRREQMFTLRMLGDHLVTLLHRNDRMGMMASIEARFPYLDEELVKFAINLPSKFKIGRTLRLHNYKHPFLIDKWVVRKTAEKYLPRELAYKKKNGFPMFGHKYLRVGEEFFKNGWVAENLALDRRKLSYMLETQNKYYVAKLASVEIYGRLFGLGMSREQVKTHIAAHAEMKF